MKSHTSSPSSGRTLAIGFGTTVAMWVVGYVSMMKPGLLVGEALFAMTLACLFFGGLVAGRSLDEGESAWKEGLNVGALSATLNLLLIGSLAGETTGTDKALRWLTWAGGAFVVSIVLVMIGSIAGAMTRQRHAAPPPRNWFNIFTGVAAATVFLLIITGGLVTGLKAGLAVPDWPNSFGHNMLLYPLSQMIGGVYYEHAHRLYGMLVGVTAITVAVSMFVYDDRRWMRWLGIGFLLMVCIQGTLGGTRVTEQSVPLAIIHGVFGQIVFATIIAIAAFTSTTWKSDRAAEIKPGAATDRKLAVTLVVTLIIQLALGAMYRHLNRHMNHPPDPLHPLITHMVVALLVTVLAIIVGGRGLSIHRDQKILKLTGAHVIGFVVLQLILGVAATIVVWSRDSEHIRLSEVIFTTAHQANGALLLATATLMMLWTRRLLATP